MNVVLGFNRQVEVDDVSDARDINSSGGNIGCHKHLHLVTLERLQGSLPGVLRFIAVNCRGIEPTHGKPLS